MKMEMNRQDLLELYQLTVMYARCYDLELGELLEGISTRCIKATGKYITVYGNQFPYTA